MEIMKSGEHMHKPCQVLKAKQSKERATFLNLKEAKSVPHTIMER